MAREHQYQTNLVWAGNKGSGTIDYRSYDRSYVISIDHKPDIHGSSDSAYLGDKSRHNPEDMLVSALSSCHMLWYLHLCSENGIIVLDYKDRATGKMTLNADGSGQFTEVMLHPRVTISDASGLEIANALHEQANSLCFIAKSCNFPVRHQPECLVDGR
jgi:organic hydroperoxide reductase OsmC/OhrA